MKAAPFGYLAPDSTDEAVEALAELGDAAKVLAGGQSLLALMSLRVAQPETLVDIGRCGLDGIVLDDALRIGATTTQNAAMAAPAVRERSPLLARALADVSHHALRNRGTIGGSVAHADPAAEVPAVLVAAGGEVVARSALGTRAIAADDLFVTHFTTALADDELLTEVRLPAHGADAWAFHEIARRRGDFALAGVAATFDLDGAGAVAGARIALFGIADRPLRASAAEAALHGHALDDRYAIEAAAMAAAGEVEPLGDIHGGALYRRRLVAVAVRRALRDVRLET